jgi:hypothetical protein
MNNTTPTHTLRFTSNMVFCKTEFMASEESVTHALNILQGEPDLELMVEVKETPMSAGQEFPCLYRVSPTKPDPEGDAFWFLTATLPNGQEVYLLQR